MAITMDVYAPFDSGPGSSVTEDGWRSMMRRQYRPGVVRDVANSMNVYADSSGMQVKVQTGEVVAEGHWGAISSEKIVAIAAAHATLARLDRIVWRLDYLNNNVVVDAITGTAAATPVAPALTRNTSIFEGSLAVVSVPAADTGIDAAQVTDARVWGGPVLPTLADDYEMFGDKVSSLQRSQLTTKNLSVNGTIYATIFKCMRDCTATKFRHYLGQAQVGGTVLVKIYAGYHPRALLDVTGASTVGVNMTVSANGPHEVTLSPTISLQAGQWVAVAHLTQSSSTEPEWGTGSVVLSTSLYNPPTLPDIAASVFKGGQTVLPSVLDTKDGTWTGRDRIPWVTLA